MTMFSVASSFASSDLLEESFSDIDHLISYRHTINDVVGGVNPFFQD
jgi:hypothetical protein